MSSLERKGTLTLKDGAGKVAVVLTLRLEAYSALATCEGNDALYNPDADEVILLWLRSESYDETHGALDGLIEAAIRRGAKIDVRD